MSIRLSGRLPRDERDGTGAISAAMVNDPESKHVIIAVVDCSKITTETDTGEVVPTARVRAIEAFTQDSPDGKEAYRIWQRAWELRTGQQQLPFELDREVREVFDNFSPDED